MSLELAHAGTCTAVHHQYYQMVDILMQHCRKSMGGLNPHALPYAPPTQQGVEKSNTCTMRNKNKNEKTSTWNTCKKKINDEWTEVTRGTKKMLNQYNHKDDRNANPYEILSVEEEDNAEETHTRKRGSNK